MRFSVMVPLMAMVGVACAAPSSGETLPCIPPMQVRWLPDSSVRLCLPAGFEVRDAQAFARRPRDSSEHWVSVTLTPGSSLEHDGEWPVTLPAGGCLGDCFTTDFRVVVKDTIAGVPAHVEHGLVSGGFVDRRPKPTFVASLDGRPAWTAVVHGASPSVAVRDSLVTALATLRLYPARVRDR